MSKKFYLAVCCVALLAVAAWAAETISYDDTDSSYTLFDGNVRPTGTSDNIVTIDYTTGGSKVNPRFVYGGRSEIEAVQGNTINFNKGKATSSVYGGYRTTGGQTGKILNGNKVFVNGGEISGQVYGGYGTGDIGEVIVTANEVTIRNDALVSTGVRAGRNVNGPITDNKLFIEDGSVKGFAMAAVTISGTATGNYAEITGGEIGSNLPANEVAVQAAQSTQGFVSKNELKITGGTIAGPVVGASSGNADVEENTVTIGGDANVASIYAGLVSDGGSAKKNKLAITGGTINGMVVIGGRSENGSAEENEVRVTGGVMTSTDPQAAVVGGQTGTGGVSGEVKKNKVFISAGKVPAATGGYSRFKNATGNSVEISGTAEVGEVVGGEASAGTLSSNTVVINGGTVTGDIYGGYRDAAFPEVQGASSDSKDNSVTISDGVITGDAIYGGFSSQNGAVTGNSVIIQGGEIGVDAIYGGKTTSGTTATGNIITIGAATFTTAPSLIGSEASSGTPTATLNMNAPSFTANELKGFTTINMLLSKVPAADAAVIATTTANLAGAVVNIAVDSNIIGLEVGSKIKLFSGAVTGAFTLGEFTEASGEWNLEADGVTVTLVTLPKALTTGHFIQPPVSAADLPAGVEPVAPNRVAKEAIAAAAPDAATAQSLDALCDDQGKVSAADIKAAAPTVDEDAVVSIPVFAAAVTATENVALFSYEAELNDFASKYTVIDMIMVKLLADGSSIPFEQVMDPKEVGDGDFAVVKSASPAEALNAGDSIEADTPYMFFFGIKNNGDYDLNKTPNNNVILDPSAISANQGGSGGGCNAGFGAGGLLLLALLGLLKKK